MLLAEQKVRAIEILREYESRKTPEGKSVVVIEKELDEKRLKTINDDLLPLLTSYLNGEIPVDEFKINNDGINKRKEYWGFKGIKGQMFFNMLVNVVNDMSELESELRAAIIVPTSSEMARSRIRTFASYVNRIGLEHVENGGTKYQRPKIASVPFFLSYFWQIQDHKSWPVYYTNSVKILADLNLWQPPADLGNAYTEFKELHEELAAIYTGEAGRVFTLYDVEHVFWVKGGNPLGGEKPGELTPDIIVAAPVEESADALSLLPDSYVPPIVSILPKMAQNDQLLADAARASGTSLERAFEKSVNAAFTILGYETQLLGQGQGRVPDGKAVDIDNSYVIIWDAKIRADGYSIGTDDRIIREYITSQSRELKKRKSMRNIYYLIISSTFKDSFDDTVRDIQMQTDVNEVIFMEADALVAMVDIKLRDPQEISLGPDGFQVLFTRSGILRKRDVIDNFA